MRIIETGHPSVKALAFSPDSGSMATLTGDGLVQLWELGAGVDPQALTVSAGAALAFSPDGDTLAVGSALETVVLWDRVRGQVARQLKPKSALPVAATAVTFLHGGRMIAAGTGDRTSPTKAGHLIVWDLARADDAPVKKTFDAHGVWAVTGTAADRAVAWGGGSKRVAVQDLAAQDTLLFPPQTKEVRALALSPDGTLLAAADDWTVRIGAVGRNQALGRHTLAGHKGRVASLAFTPDGRTLVTGGWDQRVRLWDAESGHEKAAFDWGIGRVGAVAFSPDGLVAAAAGEAGQIVIWDVDSSY